MGEERVKEYVLRVAHLHGGGTRFDVLVRMRSGVATLSSTELPSGRLTPTDIHGVIHMLWDALEGDLRIDPGVQLSLESPDR